ncbi:MAG TPA: vitamin K epoxide reductase family protein [Pyrinomonadaceae bacterium]|nr:vitamin K epoxide reductase family protein [Pyrinomonadaceae bacterium]
MSAEQFAVAKSKKFERRRVILYTAAAIISLVGLADALYLTAEHVSGRSVRCTVISGCSEVLSSPYASLSGVPLAAVGAAAYFTVFSLAILAAFGYRFAATLLPLLVGLMFMVTLWLLYVQAFVIRQFCEFCLLSAAITVMLTAIVTLVRWPPGRS